MENSLLPNKVDRRAVIGELKLAGSTDPDILYAVKDRLLAPSKRARTVGWVCIGLGSALAMTVFGLVFTLVLVPAGIILLLRSRGNIKTIDAAFDEFAGSRRVDA
jgi:hypothetical protein